MKQTALNGWAVLFPAVFLLAAFVFASCPTGGGSGTGGPESSNTPAPAVPAALPPEFAYVPGGSVSGSASYAMTVTVPNNPVYTNPGTTSTHKGVFVSGRKVVIASFYMAKYETTRALWYEVQAWAADKGYTFQHTISGAASGANRPVTGISWRDAVVWCNAYSEKEGREPVYHYGGRVLKDSRDANGAAVDGARMDKTKSGFRLPTEAEREYAARGGDPLEVDWMYTYAGSDNAEEVAWHYGNSANAPRDVGGKAPNRLGIFDLSGNVQEWGWDWMYYAADVTAATPSDGAAYGTAFPQKPMAGGGVGSNSTYSCVAVRWSWLTAYTNPYVGFRVVCPAE